MSEKEKLLELRSKIARSTKGATYLVYNDKELEVLLKVRPRSIAELSNIKGFPLKGKRVNSYGSVLIDIFTKKDLEFNISGSDENIIVASSLKSTSMFA